MTSSLTCEICGDLINSWDTDPYGTGAAHRFRTTCDWHKDRSAALEAEFLKSCGIALPEADYSCGAAFCDDPVCVSHGSGRSR